jgi:hypothetical protein
MFTKTVASSLLAVALLVLSCPNSPGQIQEATPISTDRPSVGSGTDLVPVRSTQIESGISFTHDGATNTADGPESLMRIGFSSRVELQATLPNTHWPGALPGLRYSDFSLGAKVKIGSDTQPWPLAVVGSLSFPTGSVELSSGGFDPTLLVATGRALPRNFQFSASANLTSLSTNGNPRVALSQMAASLGWCARPTLCLFAESAPFVSSAPASSGWTSDGGMSLRIAPLVQLDWRAGVTVENGDRSTFLSLGYSVRRDRR